MALETALENASHIALNVRAVLEEYFGAEPLIELLKCEDCGRIAIPLTFGSLTAPEVKEKVSITAQLLKAAGHDVDDVSDEACTCMEYAYTPEPQAKLLVSLWPVRKAA